MEISVTISEQVAFIIFRILAFAYVIATVTWGIVKSPWQDPRCFLLGVAMMVFAPLVVAYRFISWLDRLGEKKP